MQLTDSMLSWVHFGDLHVTRADEPNYRDFLRLIDDANRYLAGAVDFAVLPGDNADDGTAAQYRIVREAVDRLSIPLHILPGDHDFKSRSLDAFYDVLGAERLPAALVVAGHRCLFLDVVSAGSGGPDFRLDARQLAWIARELTDADRARQPSAIFMHPYPADLKEGGPALTALLAEHRVACVDMGHTHYNELANDGRTIFAATRSTGQIEEGPVGFSVMAIDRRVVSWRFKPLTDAWPLVLITSPADHRLITNPTAAEQTVTGSLRVRAKVWIDRAPSAVTFQLGPLSPRPMTSVDGDATLFEGTYEDVDAMPQGLNRLTVRAVGSSSAIGVDSIDVLLGHQRDDHPPRRIADGSDRDRIGAWPAKGILGTQLGPNRNGRKW
jgi:Icc protein